MTTMIMRSIRETAMNYMQCMMRIVSLDRRVHRELLQDPLLLRYCLINVTVLGLIYGLSSVQFAERWLATQSDGNVAFNPLMIVLVGISIAFFMHGGLSLFVWVFCRGIGGSPMFMPVYLAIGVAAIALWPLAPAVSALQASAGGIVFSIYALFAGLYGVSALFLAVREATGLSRIKMVLAMLATVIYVGCFLYLWL